MLHKKYLVQGIGSCSYGDDKSKIYREGQQTGNSGEPIGIPVPDPVWSQSAGEFSPAQSLCSSQTFN